jgi:hypothetical protein
MSERVLKLDESYSNGRVGGFTKVTKDTRSGKRLIVDQTILSCFATRLIHSMSVPCLCAFDEGYRYSQTGHAVWSCAIRTLS